MRTQRPSSRWHSRLLTLLTFPSTASAPESNTLPLHCFVALLPCYLPLWSSCCSTRMYFCDLRRCFFFCLAFIDLADLETLREVIARADIFTACNSGVSGFSLVSTKTAICSNTLRTVEDLFATPGSDSESQALWRMASLLALTLPKKSLQRHCLLCTPNPMHATTVTHCSRCHPLCYRSLFPLLYVTCCISACFAHTACSPTVLLASLLVL
jgi:hypothetical protein